MEPKYGIKENIGEPNRSGSTICPKSASGNGSMMREDDKHNSVNIGSDNLNEESKSLLSNKEPNITPKDQITEKSVHGRNDATTLASTENGCEKIILCGDIALSLHNDLERLQLECPLSKTNNGISCEKSTARPDALPSKASSEIVDVTQQYTKNISTNPNFENSPIKDQNNAQNIRPSEIITDTLSSRSCKDETIKSIPIRDTLRSQSTTDSAKEGPPDDTSDNVQSVKIPVSTESINTNGKTNGTSRPNVMARLQSLDSRPIYPNVPYSPYASPYGSPRSNRKRTPLRESRRISLEQSGSFQQLNQYKLMDQIGQGSYGLVKLAYSEEDSTHYAMKILSKRRLLRQAGFLRRGPKKTTSPLDRVYREIAVLKKLDHPNVVKLIEVLDDPVEDSLYMVFELVKQGEVLSIPTDKPLSEERAWSVFRETLLGLEYLHYQRIIHADLKPGNLLLTECGHVKIADLGVCNEFFGEDATMSNGSTAGTPAFRAPETLYLGQHMYCGKAADIWALGATLYALVFGNVPFVDSSIPLLYEKIRTEPCSMPEEHVISPHLQECIQRMLTKVPVQRITLPELREHVWVTRSGSCPLPSPDENCCLVQVSDDDMNSVVRSIPKLDTLILIKTMLKKHSFGNPFVRGVLTGRAPQRSRLERFVRAGRSNSAPGAYNFAIDRQMSGDTLLPSLLELTGSGTNMEES